MIAERYDFAVCNGVINEMITLNNPKEASYMAKQSPTMDAATIHNKIAEPLRRVLEPLLERPATPFDEQIKGLQDLLAKKDELPKTSVKAAEDGLRALEDAREQANSEHLNAVRANIATAVLSALRSIDGRIPLAIRQPQAAAQPASTGQTDRVRQAESGKTRKQRMSRVEAERYADQVEKVLPSSKTDRWISRSEIASKSGVPEDALQSILLKLKREQRAVPNGQRGAAGGWQKAE